MTRLSTETAMDIFFMAGNSMDELLAVAHKNFNSNLGPNCLSTGMGLPLSGGITLVLTVGFITWDERQMLGHINNKQFKIK